MIPVDTAEALDELVAILRTLHPHSKWLEVERDDGVTIVLIEMGMTCFAIEPEPDSIVGSILNPVVPLWQVSRLDLDNVIFVAPTLISVISALKGMMSPFGATPAFTSVAA